MSYRVEDVVGIVMIFFGCISGFILIGLGFFLYGLDYFLGFF